MTTTQIVDRQLLRRYKYGIGAAYILLVVLGSYISARDWLGVEDAHYFASRRNILNQLFVKRGWFWFTLVFWTSYAGRTLKTMPRSAVLRYAAATLWWIVFSQWLFGPPLMDRVFTLTGGTCLVDTDRIADPQLGQKVVEKAVSVGVDAAVNIASKVASAAPEAAATAAGEFARRVASRSAVTSVKCRASGGTWEGGHDPSGHIFLLVHSSLVLWMEILPELLSSRRPARRSNWAVKIPLALLSLWAFMLVMTSVYFHSATEKASGLLCGLLEAYLVYIVGEKYSWGHLFDVADVQSYKESVPVEQPSGTN